MTVTQPPYDTDTLVLVGASVRAAAESARRANFRVIGIDLFGDTDTRRVCHRFFKISGSANSAEKESDTILDACAGLPMLQVGGFRSPLPLIDRLSSVCTQLGPSHSQGIQLRDPFVLENLAKPSGLRIPQTWPSSRPPNTPDHGRLNRWLVKEKDSSGGIGIRWWPGDCEAMQDAVIQQWVPGRNLGVTFLSDGSQAQLLGVCRSLFTRKGSWPFVYAGSLGPLRPSDSIVGRLQRLGHLVVDAFQLPGLFNADVIVDRQGQVWLLEINFRWSSSMELIERGLDGTDGRSAGISLIGSAIKRERIPERTLIQGQSDRLFVKRILYARRPRQFRIAEWTAQLGPCQSLHDVPQDGQLIGRHEPILTLITEVDRAAAKPFDCYKTLLRMC